MRSRRSPKRAEEAKQAISRTTQLQLMYVSHITGRHARLCCNYCAQHLPIDRKKLQRCAWSCSITFWVSHRKNQRHFGTSTCCPQHSDCSALNLNVAPEIFAIALKRRSTYCVCFYNITSTSSALQSTITGRAHNLSNAIIFWRSTLE